MPLRLEFEQGKRLNPKSAEMPYNLGKLYSIQDNWADARREFEAAIRLDPPIWRRTMGWDSRSEALGDDAGAVANYKKAIELNEARRAGFASPYVNMSALSNRTGDREAALEYARKALAANPQSDRALFQMAKAYEYQGDLNAAAEALNRAIEINPRSSSYFYVLGTVYRKLGKMEESRKAMEAFAKLDRESNELEQKRREYLEREMSARLAPPDISRSLVGAPALAAQVHGHHHSAQASATPAMFPDRRKTNSICSRKWAAASRSFDYDNDGWLGHLSGERLQFELPRSGPQTHQLSLPQQSRRHLHRCDARRPA